MITNIRTIVAPDLFSDNEVANLVRNPASAVGAFSGVFLYLSGVRANDALMKVLGYCFDMIGNQCPDYDAWLLVGTSTWQPNTKIVRYRRLWGALEARAITFSESARAFEVTHEGERGLKFFGAKQLSSSPVETIVRVLLEERCSYIVMVRDAGVLGHLVDVGWTGNLVDDLDLVDSIARIGGLVLRRSGEFDDGEIGVVCVGRPEVVSCIFN